MFLLELSNETLSIYKEIKVYLANFKAIQTYTICKITSTNIQIPNLETINESNFVCLDIDTMQDISSQDLAKLDNFIMDIIDESKHIVIRTTNASGLFNIKEYLNQYGVSYSVVLNGKLESISTVSKVVNYDILIIREIYREKLVYDGYTTLNGVIKYKLNSGYSVTNQFNETRQYSTPQELIISMFYSLTDKEVDYLTKQLESNTALLDSNLEVEGFVPFLPVPAGLFVNSIQDIIDYKYQIFDIIKNIEPDEYDTADKQLISYLNSKSYLPLKLIKEVVNN